MYCYFRRVCALVGFIEHALMIPLSGQGCAEVHRGHLREDPEEHGGSHCSPRAWKISSTGAGCRWGRRFRVMTCLLFVLFNIKCLYFTMGRVFDLLVDFPKWLVMTRYSTSCSVHSLIYINLPVGIVHWVGWLVNPSISHQALY